MLKYNVSYFLLDAVPSENQVGAASKLALALTIKGISPDVCTFNSLIQGLCLSSKFETALEVFQGMKNKGCQPDEFTYNMLIDWYCTKGKLDSALRLLKEMESSGCPKCYNLQYSY
ncbi:tetratricopeptide-like helical domain-containing protein [Artemisia annua]|uniref:Tetratricopeptide-like helical domain-containing protein n=1 Tax=Artemisia annua TaxID=35608 RepID=A0A2U1KF70_ARTAN|nr:tetratricopeptide-like helical domain-containing protein [Artemisia annua]